MAKRNAKGFSKFKNKKVTGKINLNIESIMAAKVLRNRGGLRMGDLKNFGPNDRRTFESGATREGFQEKSETCQAREGLPTKI